MRYHNPQKKNGTITTRVVCAVCFLAFTFLWLFAFQADVLAVAQHVLSGGVTRYDRTVGAVIITAVLFLLQTGVYALTKLSRRTHALTYLPSMLILAMLTDINCDIDRQFSFGAWVWVIPLVLVVWGVAVWLSRQLLPFESDSKQLTGLFSRRVWVNLVQMAAMMLAVALVGNSNAVFHFKAHAEEALLRGDTEEALRVGEKSLETDAHLTMLRAYALSRQHQLGERLFRYPVAGTSKTLLPSYTRLLMLPADTIWKHLGGRPLFKMDAQRLLNALEADSLATDAVGDYRLCGHLIDRQLDQFVEDLPRYYEVADSLPLPQHYKEALILYKHQRVNPSLIYSDPVLDEDWENFRQLSSLYPEPMERRLHVFDHYFGSYWYYYFY